MSRPDNRRSDAPVLVTMGEPAGIGAELAVRAFQELGGRIGNHPLRLVGDAAVFRACGMNDENALIATTPVVDYVVGSPRKANAASVIAAIEGAVSLALSGDAAAVVTAPINKAVLAEAGFAYPGHTEFLQMLTKAPRAVMMLASDKLRVVPLTVHIPLSEVPRAITMQSIIETAEIVLSALKQDFSLTAPRLSVAGLNPHAGEKGVLGPEDIAIIRPAVDELRARGHTVSGPHSADTMFRDEARAGYDAALCMYHDQGLIPIKTLSFWDGVNVTLGLPIVRTSPDHGTAFDIAGQEKADPRSMIAAIRLAAKIADSRSR